MRKASFYSVAVLIAGTVGAACYALMPEDQATHQPNLEFQNVAAPWSVTPVNDGYRYEVRQADILPGDQGEPRERSESYDRGKLQLGQAYEISFSMEIAPGQKNSAKWMTLMQLQSTFDPGEEGHSPPFALYMDGERMNIAMRHSPLEITPPGAFDYMSLYNDKADVKRGHIYQMRMRVRFDRGGTGAVKFWRDGALLVSHDGPFGFNDRVGPYLKLGVYRASAPENYAVTMKNVAIKPVHAVDE